MPSDRAVLTEIAEPYRGRVPCGVAASAKEGTLQLGRPAGQGGSAPGQLELQSHRGMVNHSLMTAVVTEPSANRSKSQTAALHSCLT